MNGPPAWLWGALAVSLAAIPVCLIVATVSALIDRTDRADKAAVATEATEEHDTGRTSL